MKLFNLLNHLSKVISQRLIPCLLALFLISIGACKKEKGFQQFENKFNQPLGTYYGKITQIRDYYDNRYNESGDIIDQVHVIDTIYQLDTVLLSGNILDSLYIFHGFHYQTLTDTDTSFTLKYDEMNSYFESWEASYFGNKSSRAVIIYSNTNELAINSFNFTNGYDSTPPRSTWIEFSGRK